jgi:hypothetical protein
MPFIILDLPRKCPSTQTNTKRSKVLLRKTVTSVSNVIGNNSTVSDSHPSSFEAHRERKKNRWIPVHSLGELLLRAKKVEEGLSQNETKMENSWIGMEQNFSKPKSNIKASVNIGRVEIIDETRPRNNNPSMSSKTTSIPGIMLNFDTGTILSELSFKNSEDINKV